MPSLLVLTELGLLVRRWRVSKSHAKPPSSFKALWANGTQDALSSKCSRLSFNCCSNKE